MNDAEITPAEQLEDAAIQVQDSGIELNVMLQTLQEALQEAHPAAVAQCREIVNKLRKRLNQLDEALSTVERSM